jgi:hypothetical protein
MPETEGTSYLDAAMHTSLSRRKLLGLGVAGAVLTACSPISKKVEPVVLPRSSTRIGGVWTKPPNGAVFTTPEFEACAVPKRGEGAPKITHVDFTADSKNPDDPGWQTEAKVEKPNKGQQYCATIDMKKITGTADSKPQTVDISFDVYNADDEVKLAPEGERKVTYAPSK